MKKNVLMIIISFALCVHAQAQTLISKVPAKASMVIKYAGENFSSLMPIEKMDNYDIVRKELYKLIGVDTLTSLKNTGINFEKDNYQYATSTDSTLSFVTLLNLKNTAQFSQFIAGAYGAKKLPEQKNGYNFLPISTNTYISWNQTEAVIVNTNYLKKVSYYTHKYETDTATAVISDMAVDTAVMVEIPKPKKNPTIKKDGYKVPPKKGVKGKKPIPAKKTKKPTKKIDEAITTIVEPYAYDPIADSIENVKRELWEQQQDALAKKRQTEEAMTIFENSFLNKTISIENEIDYSKIIAKDAHVSLWVNNDKLTSLYKNYSFSSMYSFSRAIKNITKEDTTAGYKSAINIYFEKDNMRIEQKSFSTDEKLTNLSKQIMNSKQNPDYVNFINPGNLGYFAMSINTEAMVHYYYTVMKQYLKNTPYVGEYSDMVEVYIDLLEIMIDEKGIAELNPGNYLFVMHDMQTKLVNYTDYTYDTEYNKTEVKKTKKELSPNFTYIMDTKKEAFMERIARLPLKYAEKEKFTYKDRNGYYELMIDSSKYPLSSLYFMIKNGKAMVTTNKQVIDMNINNTAFVVDEEAKKSVLNNNYAIKLDAKKIFEVLEKEATTVSNKKILSYLKNNMGPIKSISNFKEGMIQGTTTMSITGNHANSLAFFFDMLNTVYEIKESEKADELIKKD